MNEHKRFVLIFDVRSHLALNRENKDMHISDRRGGNPHHLRDQLWPVQINISMKSTQFIPDLPAVTSSTPPHFLHHTQVPLLGASLTHL